MAYSPINFLNAPLVEPHGVGDFVQNLLKGFEAARKPTQIRQEEEMRGLNNKIQGINLEYLPKEKQAELAYALMRNKYYGPEKEGQIAYQNLQNQFYAPKANAELSLLNAQQQNALANALLSQKKASAPFGGETAPGAIGQAMWLDKIRQQHGESSRQYQEAQQAFNAENESKSATTQRNAALANSMSFRLLPPAEKTRVISTAVGLGFDPTEASNLLSNGVTLNDMAKQRNKNLAEIEPNYPISNESIKQVRNRGAFVAEIKNLEKNMNEAASLGGRKIKGYSPTQIWSAIKNDDPDTQGKILAARALQPELASLRIKIAGGAAGIEALREMQEASLARSHIFESTISGEAREKMNHYISKWIGEAQETYGKSIMTSGKLGTENKLTGPPSGAKVRKYNPKTGGFE